MGLPELLIDLEGLSDEEAEERGWAEYRSLYLNRGGVGVLPLYKGEDVFFFGKDRYDHAFRTSPNRIRSPFSKTHVARDRVERIRWIGAVLRGEVPNTQCWAVAPLSQKSGRDRLYVVVANRYIVRLGRRDTGGWKFSTAYTATAQDIKRYTQGGTLMWTVPEKVANGDEPAVGAAPEKKGAP
jgi:hypothetical protein